MDGACSKYEEEMCTCFWRAKLRERDYLQDLGADERIIIKCFFK